MGFDLAESLTHILPTECAKYGLKPLDPAWSERHGSMEWIFHKEGKGIERFVSVALTSLVPGLPEALYAIEIWAGADNGTRYARRLVADFRAIEAERFSAGTESMLRDHLGRAIKVAEQLGLADLSDAYLPSRG